MVPAQDRAQVSGGRRDILLCCRRRYRRSGGESSSRVAEVLRVPGSCCSPEPRGDLQGNLREVLQVLQVSGLEGRMEDSPGLAGQSCLQVLLIKSPLSVLTLLLVRSQAGRDKYPGKLSDSIMPLFQST